LSRRVSVIVGLAAAPIASPIANLHAASHPYVIDPPNVIGRGKNGVQYSLGKLFALFQPYHMSLAVNWLALMGNAFSGSLPLYY